jgi:hypothetical protein
MTSSYKQVTGDKNVTKVGFNRRGAEVEFFFLIGRDGWPSRSFVMAVVSARRPYLLIFSAPWRPGGKSFSSGPI